MICVTKEEIRQLVRQQKRAMEEKEISVYSEKIIKQVEKMAIWKKSQWIFTYISYNQEVATQNYLWDWIQSGKKVAVPKIVDGEMTFIQLLEPQQLQAGYQGIIEPAYGSCVDGKEALILMPGLAFDLQMHRIGYGGGFYDRYLKKWGKADSYLLALAFDFQVFEEIPYEDFDQKVDAIVTPNSVYLSEKGA